MEKPEKLNKTALLLATTTLTTVNPSAVYHATKELTKARIETNVESQALKEHLTVAFQKENPELTIPEQESPYM